MALDWACETHDSYMNYFVLTLDDDLMIVASFHSQSFGKDTFDDCIDTNRKTKGQHDEAQPEMDHSIAWCRCQNRRTQNRKRIDIVSIKNGRKPFDISLHRDGATTMFIAI
jgi:hypothetical protein